MDNRYVEKLVSKKTEISAIMLRVAVLVAALFFSYIITFFMGIYGIIAIFFLGYVTWYVFFMTSVEYEFVLVNNELTIDKIYGKNKRKNQQTVDVSKCEVIAPIESTYVSGYHRNTQMKAFDYTSGENSEPVYILIVPYGASTAKIYMEFDQKMLDAMKMAAPGKIKLS
ncbi:MAG: hypothetical protein K1W19_01955 [Lachnospiraceae bacterium]|nr:hypothetical protein [Lachnospiraceae bacterium]MCI9370954.1 hypothetical protein [Lachnospiraceae bacterium]MDE7308356.1 hypothetical protein [Lachnospiraceae bacterium]